LRAGLVALGCWRYKRANPLTAPEKAMPLNGLQRVFYQNLAENRLLDHEGQSFEDFFVDVARRYWGDDFEPIRAYGKHGDLKCDGRHLPTGTIFQCYAPRRANSVQVHKKIKIDFHGALAVWASKMKGWSIAINDRQGLDALATLEVDTLRSQHATIVIKTVLPVEIVRMALSLSLANLAELFGIEITERDTVLTRVAFSELGPVIDSLAGVDPIPSLTTITLPASKKIEFNSLGMEIAALLRQGDLLASHVDDYFRKTGRVEVGERIGELMKLNYEHMKADGYDPSQIFHGLINLCGSLDRPKRQGLAVLAIVAYYFHKCDIFENA
jgi:hypothetical protein